MTMYVLGGARVVPLVGGLGNRIGVLIYITPFDVVV